MSIKKRVLSLALCVIMIISFASIINANDYNQTTKSNVVGYDYPIKPGTDEWIKLGDRAKRGEVSQIPEKILENLTTDELIETVLNYPFINDMYYYDSIEKGYLAVSERFNGLKELSKRADSGAKLLEKYKKMSVITDSTKAITKHFFDLPNIEILLRQKEIVSKLSKTENDTLEKEVENKYKQKKAHSDIYGVMKTISYRAQAEIQNSIVSAQVYTYVYTPNGTAVGVEKYGDGLTSTEKTNIANDITSSYPGATILSSATWNYNCHSYAWYNQSTSNVYWINYPSAYMTDGSYTYTTSWSAGRKMYYNYSGYEHSGVITVAYYGPPAPGEDWSSLTQLTSKWGHGCLVRHMADNCPYYVSDSYMEAYYR